MRETSTEYSTVTEYVVRLIDITLIFGLAHSAAIINFSTSLDSLSSAHNILAYFCSALAIPMLPRFESRSPWYQISLTTHILHLAAAVGAILSIGVFFVSITQQNQSLSVSWIVMWYLLCVIGLSLLRIVMRALMLALRHYRLNQRRVIIVGYGPNGRELHKRAQHHSSMGYKICAVYDSVSFPLTQPGIEIIREIDQLPSAIQKHHINEVWITLPLNESSQLRQLHYLLRNSLVDIRWVPDTSPMSLLSHQAGDLLGMPAVELNCPPVRDIHGLAKELFDRTFALCVLLMLTPLFTLLAIAIKCSSCGPVFFSQPRLGLNGRIFHVYKFRSMRIHAESNNKVTQATRDDPRITPIGKFIRSTSLDELPQFLNVLKGDMSVVGPRPHALPHNDLYKDKLIMYMQRHRVKPGITGWAQINGFRGETDTHEKMARRVAYDLHYIRNWSFWMDLKIILWTAFKGWTDRNAF